MSINTDHSMTVRASTGKSPTLRTVRVKHYAGGRDVHLSMGIDGSARAKVAACLAPAEARDLAAALNEAADAATEAPR